LRALTLGISTNDLLSVAGRSPVLQGIAIIAGTFVLEDATSIGTAMAVQDHHVSLKVGVLALYAGIVLGDLGLYGLGMLAERLHENSAWARRLVPEERRIAWRDWVDNHLLRLVFTARFLPGMRLPAYTTCGFLGARFWRFAAGAIGATLIWTSLLFALSMKVGQFLIDHLGTWRWTGAAGFILMVLALTRLIARAQAANKAPL
jgi:membrane protein DedA with SNARE-associated domain